jgi:hypothetical protein
MFERIRNLFSPTANSSPTALRPSARLDLEALEGREVPSAVFDLRPTESLSPDDRFAEVGIIIIGGQPAPGSEDIVGFHWGV